MSIYVIIFLHFKLLTDDKQRELLCDTGIHTEETYILSDEDSVISLPEVTTVDIIKVAAIEWSKIELETKRAWRELATMINNLPILGDFKTVPGIVTEEEIKTALSKDHHKFINTMQNILRTKKISMKQCTEVKKFGKEQVEIGDKVYKYFCLPHLLKLSLFGHNYSLFNNRLEIVERKKKSIIVHIKSMERMISLFYRNGISAFGYEGQDNLFYSCAGKVILRNTRSEKESVGYIINEHKVLLESGIELRLQDIYLPEFTRENGTWLHRYNDDTLYTYVVVDFHPIRMKICNSGNCQILFSRIVLSNDKTKIIINK